MSNEPLSDGDHICDNDKPTGYEVEGPKLSSLIQSLASTPSNKRLKIAGNPPFLMGKTMQGFPALDPDEK